MMFHDRHDAGRKLAQLLLAHKGPDTIILGLPRGGIPVAYEVARALEAPLDAFIVRKLGVPGRDELAMGAIATGGVQVLSTDIIRQLQIPSDVITSVIVRERAELERREQLYRDHHLPPAVRHRDVILVDDGMATGASMLAAIRALRMLGPRTIIVAVPVASGDALRLLRSQVDDWAVVTVPEDLEGVGLWYADFTQTTDDEVRALLNASSRPPQVAA